MPWSLAGQTAAMTSADARSRAEQLLKQMTIEEKVGQMNQSSGIVMPLLANEKPDNLIVQGTGRLHPLAHRCQGDQPPAASRSRQVPPSHPHPFRIRRHPRIPHRLPDPAGYGFLVGSGSRRSGATSRRSKTRAPPASAGPSPPWSTSPAIPAGVASWRVLARILISVQPWHERRFAASRANRSAQTACWPA